MKKSLGLTALSQIYLKQQQEILANCLNHLDIHLNLASSVVMYIRIFLERKKNRAARSNWPLVGVGEKG